MRFVPLQLRPVAEREQLARDDLLRHVAVSGPDAGLQRPSSRIPGQRELHHPVRLPRPPPSAENACSHRGVGVVTPDHVKRTRSAGHRTCPALEHADVAVERRTPEGRDAAAAAVGPVDRPRRAAGSKKRNDIPMKPPSWSVRNTSSLPIPSRSGERCSSLRIPPIRSSPPSRSRSRGCGPAGCPSEVEVPRSRPVALVACRSPPSSSFCVGSMGRTHK